MKRIEKTRTRAEKGWAAMIALLVGATVAWILGA